MRVLAFIFGLAAAPAVAHEFWIEPLAYQVEPDGTLEGRLVNGQEFEGVNIPYLPQRFRSFVQFGAEGASRPVEGRVGDSPALRVAPVGEGLQVVAYVSGTAKVDYDEWAAFQRFAEHKDFEDIAARHEARGLPRDGFSEAYTRFAKTLVAVGDGAGADFRAGLETEIVALANPYTEDLAGGLPVQVWYREAPRPGAQVELFEKAADGSVAISYHETDARGVARLPVQAGHAYLVDAVVLREPGPPLLEVMDVAWETLWASLTFAVPE